MHDPKAVVDETDHTPPIGHSDAPPNFYPQIIEG